MAWSLAAAQRLSRAWRGLKCHLTPPSSGRPKGRFAPFAPPLMSNVRARKRAVTPPFLAVVFLLGAFRLHAEDSPLSLEAFREAPRTDLATSRKRFVSPALKVGTPLSSRWPAHSRKGLYALGRRAQRSVLLRAVSGRIETCRDRRITVAEREEWLARIPWPKRSVSGEVLLRRLPHTIEIVVMYLSGGDYITREHMRWYRGLLGEP